MKILLSFLSPGNSRDATNYKDILIHNVRQTAWTRPMARHVVPFSSEQWATSIQKCLNELRKRHSVLHREEVCVLKWFSMHASVHVRQDESERIKCSGKWNNSRLRTQIILYLLKYLLENTDVNSIKGLKSHFEFILKVNKWFWKKETAHKGQCRCI